MQQSPLFVMGIIKSTDFATFLKIIQKNIRTFVCVSPYVNVYRLARLCENAEDVTVICANMTKKDKSYLVRKINLTTLKIIKNLHAKMYICEYKTDGGAVKQFVAIGSMNFSRAGLEGKNIELLYVSREPRDVERAQKIVKELLQC